MLSESQLVRVSVLRLRVSMSRQYTRSALSDEPILRRRIHELWITCAAFFGRATGGASRPYGLRVPSRN